MSLEHTTMYAIAEQLWHWDTHNLYIGRESSYHWDNLGERERQDWYAKAVRLIDEIEPVWWARTAENRRKLQTDAYFRGADTMSEQIYEDYNIIDVPHFVSPFEDGDVEWIDWKIRNKKESND